MSIASGRARIQGALKDLNLRWGKAQTGWHDRVSLEFERRYLTSLEPKIRSAIQAIEQLREVVERMRRECGDQSSL